jgi:hypothetical protein
MTGAMPLLFAESSHAEYPGCMGKEAQVSLMHGFLISSVQTWDTAYRTQERTNTSSTPAI